MKRLYYLDKLGWPVEIIKGRWFLNFFRRLIHTRKNTFKRPSCFDPMPMLNGGDCWQMGSAMDCQKKHSESLEDVGYR